jgi:hypothetical protein
MREGILEILLLDENSSPLKEVSISDKSYAIGAVKQEYTIQVRIYRDAAGNFPSDRFRIGVIIDGNTLPYWKRFDLTLIEPESSEEYITASFVGFKKNATDLRCFQFTKPSLINSDNSNVSEDDNNDRLAGLGSIRATLHTCEATRGEFNNETRFYEVPSGHIDMSIMKSKSKSDNNNNIKGLIDLNIPSLVTRAGRAYNQIYDPLTPLTKWKNSQDDLKKHMEISIYYHVVPVIIGLQCLKKATESTTNKRSRARTNSSSSSSSETTDISTGASKGKGHDVPVAKKKRLTKSTN